MWAPGSMLVLIDLDTISGSSLMDVSGTSQILQDDGTYQRAYLLDELFGI
jgi:hypothetical protein